MGTVPHVALTHGDSPLTPRWYVDHRSLALDARILLLTLATVFRRTGISARGEATMGEATMGEFRPHQ
ncbi:MAG: hypothetical protein ACI4Q3_03620 [Kiritimatiellia bacterium]